MAIRELNSIDGIVDEPTINFVGKDGFFWWVGEVEDNRDPEELGRVKVRVLGYYTNVRGGTVADLKTDHLPWATVLQHTCQPGNDGQGESSGQLQPGAIVMGFFMDGENAQMPIVIGVMRVKKDPSTKKERVFAFTGEDIPEHSPGVVNPASEEIGKVDSISKGDFCRPGDQNNSVSTVETQKTLETGGSGSPNNIGTVPGINGSSGNPQKPRGANNGIPVARGSSGPWGTLEHKLSYLLEDLSDTAGLLVKTEEGNFLNIVTGKIETTEKLLGKIQDFLSAIFTQVISAIRQQMTDLMEKLNIATIVAGSTGIPFVQFGLVRAAVTAILNALCIEDSKLMGFINDPLSSIKAQLNSYMEGIISQILFVQQTVDKVVSDVICNVQKILDSMKDVISKVTKIVSTFQKAKELMETWSKGAEIFTKALNITSITSLITLFTSLLGGGCNRKNNSGTNVKTWFPLFGVTKCTAQEFALLKTTMGTTRGTCNSPGLPGDNIFDSLSRDADPDLTKAKTEIDGSYMMYMGTPGRKATVETRTNGTTWTSVKLNQAKFAEWNYRKKLEEKRSKAVEGDSNDISDAELEAKVKAYVKQQTKGDEGVILADHLGYSGNLTTSVSGDDCKIVDKDKVLTVDGDFALDITGNCDITIGGALTFNAQGAPKASDGEDNIQKHLISFGSDVEMVTNGADMHIKAGGTLLTDFTKYSITGGEWNNEVKSQIYGTGEFTVAAENAVNIITPTIDGMINSPMPTTPKVKTGLIFAVGGSVDIIQTPAGSATDAIPRFLVGNPAGPISLTSGGTGYNNNVLTGAYNVNVAAGVIAMNCSTAASIIAGGAMTLTAGAVMKLTATSIFLN
tara:strand:+ start:10976 stop:13531 length:2556 start_codon:yes stop_codon:yes gene_type:complete